MAESTSQVTLKITSDGSLRLIGQAGKDFEDFGRKAEQSGRRSSDAFSRANAAVVSLRAAALALASSLVVRKILDYSDAWTNVQSRLRLVTTTSKELSAATTALFAISQEARTGFEATADLYSRLARATKTLGTSQAELLRITETVNKTITISGVSADAANASLVQLGQGLAAGALRGDELNSVMEQTPRLAQAIAEGMGVTIGQLRKLGAEGKISAEAIINALKSQAEAVDSEFSQVTATVGSALTVLQNSLLRVVGLSDQAAGSSRGLAQAILSVAKAFDDLNVGQRVEQFATKLIGAISIIKPLFDGLAQIPGTTFGADVAQDLAKLQAVLGPIANASKNAATEQARYNALIGEFSTLAKEQTSGAQAAKTQVDALAKIYAAAKAAGADLNAESLAIVKAFGLVAETSSQATPAVADLTREQVKAAKASASLAQNYLAEEAQLQALIAVRTAQARGLISETEATLQLAAAQAKAKGFSEEQVANLVAGLRAIEDLNEAIAEQVTLAETAGQALESWLDQVVAQSTAQADLTQAVRNSQAEQIQYIDIVRQGIAVQESYEVITRRVRIAQEEARLSAAGFAGNARDTATATVDLAIASEQATRELESLRNAGNAATITFGDLREASQKAIDDILHDGGDLFENLGDLVDNFAQRVQGKIWEGILFGKGNFDQTLTANFSGLFGQNGILGGLINAFSGSSANTLQLTGQQGGQAFTTSFSQVVGGFFSGGGFSPLINSPGGGATVAQAGQQSGAASGLGFLDGFLSTVAGLFGGGGGGGAGGGGLFGGLGGLFGGSGAAGSSGGLSAGLGFFSAFSSVVNADNIGGQIGGGIGAAIGGYFSGGSPEGIALGAQIGSFFGDLFGGLFGKQGRINKELKAIEEFFEEATGLLAHATFPREAAESYGELENALHAVGIAYANLSDGGLGTIKRVANLASAAFVRHNLTLEEAQEVALDLARALDLDLVSAVGSLNKALQDLRGKAGDFTLSEYLEELAEGQEDIIRVGEALTGIIQLFTGFSPLIDAAAAAQRILAQEFLEVGINAGVAESQLTDLFRQIESGAIGVEEALLSLNNSFGLNLDLDDLSFSVDAVEGEVQRLQAVIQTLGDLGQAGGELFVRSLFAELEMTDRQALEQIFDNIFRNAIVSAMTGALVEAFNADALFPVLDEWSRALNDFISGVISEEDFLAISEAIRAQANPSIEEFADRLGVAREEAERVLTALGLVPDEVARGAGGFGDIGQSLQSVIADGIRAGMDDGFNRTDQEARIRAAITDPLRDGIIEAISFAFINAAGIETLLQPILDLIASSGESVRGNFSGREEFIDQIGAAFAEVSPEIEAFITLVASFAPALAEMLAEVGLLTPAVESATGGVQDITQVFADLIAGAEAFVSAVPQTLEQQIIAIQEESARLRGEMFALAASMTEQGEEYHRLAEASREVAAAEAERLRILTEQSLAPIQQAILQNENPLAAQLALNQAQTDAWIETLTALHSTGQITQEVFEELRAGALAAGEALSIGIVEGFLDQVLGPVQAFIDAGKEELTARERLAAQQAAAEAILVANAAALGEYINLEEALAAVRASGAEQLRDIEQAEREALLADVERILTPLQGFLDAAGPELDAFERLAAERDSYLQTLSDEAAILGQVIDLTAAEIRVLEAYAVQLQRLADAFVASNIQPFIDAGLAAGDALSTLQDDFRATVGAIDELVSATGDTARGVRLLAEATESYRLQVERLRVELLAPISGAIDAIIGTARSLDAILLDISTATSLEELQALRDEGIASVNFFLAEQIRGVQEGTRLQNDARRDLVRNQIDAARDIAAAQISIARETAAAQIKAARDIATAQIQAARDAAATQIDTARETAATQIDTVRETAATQIEALREQLQLAEALQRLIKDATRAFRNAIEDLVQGPLPSLQAMLAQIAGASDPELLGELQSDVIGTAQERLRRAIAAAQEAFGAAQELEVVRLQTQEDQLRQLIALQGQKFEDEQTALRSLADTARGIADAARAAREGFLLSENTTLGVREQLAFADTQFADALRAGLGGDAEAAQRAIGLSGDLFRLQGNAFAGTQEGVARTNATLASLQQLETQFGSIATEAEQQLEATEETNTLLADISDLLTALGLTGAESQETLQSLLDSVVAQREAIQAQELDTTALVNAAVAELTTLQNAFLSRLGVLADGTGTPEAIEAQIAAAEAARDAAITAAEAARDAAITAAEAVRSGAIAAAEAARDAAIAAAEAARDATIASLESARDTTIASLEAGLRSFLAGQEVQEQSLINQLRANAAAGLEALLASVEFQFRRIADLENAVGADVQNEIRDGFVNLQSLTQAQKDLLAARLQTVANAITPLSPAIATIIQGLADDLLNTGFADLRAASNDVFAELVKIKMETGEIDPAIIAALDFMRTELLSAGFQQLATNLLGANAATFSTLATLLGDTILGRRFQTLADALLNNGFDSLEGLLDTLDTTLTENVRLDIVSALTDLESQLGIDLTNLKNNLLDPNSGILSLQDALGAIDAALTDPNLSLIAQLAAIDAALGADLPQDIRDALTALRDALIAESQAGLQQLATNLLGTSAATFSTLATLLGDTTLGGRFQTLADALLNNGFDSLEGLLDTLDTTLTENVRADIVSGLTDLESQLGIDLTDLKNNLLDPNSGILSLQDALGAIDAALTDPNLSLIAQLTAIDAALGADLPQDIRDALTALRDALITESQAGLQQLATNLLGTNAATFSTLATLLGDTTLGGRFQTLADALLNNGFDSLEELLDTLDTTLTENVRADIVSGLTDLESQLGIDLTDLKNNLLDPNSGILSLQDTLGAIDAALTDPNLSLIAQLTAIDAALGDDLPQDIRNALIALRDDLIAESQAAGESDISIFDQLAQQIATSLGVTVAELNVFDATSFLRILVNQMQLGLNNDASFGNLMRLQIKQLEDIEKTLRFGLNELAAIFGARGVADPRSAVPTSGDETNFLDLADSVNNLTSFNVGFPPQISGAIQGLLNLLVTDNIGITSRLDSINGWLQGIHSLSWNNPQGHLVTQNGLLSLLVTDNIGITSRLDSVNGWLQGVHSLLWNNPQGHLVTQNGLLTLLATDNVVIVSRLDSTNNGLTNIYNRMIDPNAHPNLRLSNIESLLNNTSGGWLQRIHGRLGAINNNLRSIVGDRPTEFVTPAALGLHGFVRDQEMPIVAHRGERVDIWSPGETIRRWSGTENKPIVINEGDISVSIEANPASPVLNAKELGRAIEEGVRRALKDKRTRKELGL